jgi:8-oxo-dGTP pyrophosphatase MutT (NUDIX family)
MSHIDTIPVGARPASRVLVISDAGSILLLRAQDYRGHRWWLMPGGGLDAGESFEDAARRELREETGRDLPVGPLIWTRRHVYNWNGTAQDQYERYFVARCKAEFAVAPAVPDTYVIGHRWWHLRQIQDSSDDFTPRRLATYLPELLQGHYPGVPFDCGV